jgi:hypothetical protein
MKADEIFALYLYRLSNRLCSTYYKEAALPFVISFRECLNEYGWGKKVGYDGGLNFNDLHDNRSDLSAEIERNPKLR